MKYWYKFWCKIFGSIMLIRIGVVLQDQVFSRYWLTVDENGKPKLAPIRQRVDYANIGKKKPKKNPI